VHLEGRNVDAIREFEISWPQPEEVDALYGLGLPRKPTAEQAAIKSFKKALALSKELVTKAPSPDSEVFGEVEDMLVARGRNDRYMMLVRMIKQRLAELNAPVADE
jgi:hypothetical protein